MDLARHVSLSLQVKGLVHFTEASLTNQMKEEVALMEGGVLLEPR